MSEKKYFYYIYVTMTGGGLMQLVAYGAQDVYLSGNPQVTFWKMVYKRHTNFAMQSVEAVFNGAVGFGRRVTCVVPRVGDLMGKTYLQATLPEIKPLAADAAPTDTYNWINEVGHFLIDEIEVQIGGQIIDKHYGLWLSIWSQLALDINKHEGYNDMICRSDDMVTPAQNLPEKIVYVPLQFWFCKHEGLALPLIALQYHEVRFVLEFAPIDKLINVNGTAYDPANTDIQRASLYIDYIFLDTDERRRMAQTSHEYLIDQLQFTGSEDISNSSRGIKLNFNHPVKELVWVTTSDKRDPPVYDIDGTNGPENPIDECKLQFNGHDRFSVRKGRYFNLVQPYQHHTRIPHSHGINVYSFALYPELEQPSGASNFSRIDNAVLNLTITDVAKAELSVEAWIFACNVNVLRIMSGMGGMAFSN